ncbi:MAG TPA: rod shape-determining protein [Eubacteriaceae bacterium]|jgi:rod shape-determining protein MreB|nr:rod shape-determining protein [Eubacteriaceae bacterium]
MFSLKTDIGIDLGTASVLVYIKNKGVVLQEPSVVAIDTNTNKILAVGEEARRMLGRTPGNIVAIRPLRDGVISDFSITQRMLKYFIRTTCGRKIFRPRVMVGVPSGVTEVEKRAVEEAVLQAGASKPFIIEEPVAAAIGADMDITQPSGNMVVDIGGGTTDIAVLSLGGIVVNSSIKFAGDKFDEAIIRHMRKAHNLLIGDRTAEDLKINIGTAYPREEEVFMDIRGRDLVSGLPKTISIGSEEMREALAETIITIIDGVRAILEKTPPELAADISDKGIFMTGGGALLYGLDKLMEEKTGVPVHVAENAISCVAYGTGKALENLDLLQNITGNEKSNKYT